MPKDVWSDDQKKYLMKHIEKQTFKEIGDTIGKSELAVQLYVLRKRIPVGSKVSRNMVIEILKLKFVNPDYFQPNREFYTAVRITQKRWWNLFFGREKVSPEEYIRLCEHFQVSMKDAFEARQLNLFEHD